MEVDNVKFSDTVPRRNKLYELEPAEKALYDALQEVEKIGADPKLTDIVVGINKLREDLADYIEEKVLPQRK